MMNNNMYRYIKNTVIFVMTFALAFTSLTGCKLAEDDEKAVEIASMDESEEVIYEDLYVGSFFTTDNLFYDVDLDFTDEEVMDMANGEEVEIYKPKVEGDKIYATKVERTNSEGSKYETYVFEGCDGAAAFYFYYDNKQEGITYEVLGEDSMTGATDVEFQLSKNGEETTNNILTTIYLNKIVGEQKNEEYDGVLINTYDVFQTVTGEVYLVQGEGTYARGSETISRYETVTTTITGKEMSHTTNFKAEFKVIMPADNTKFILLNGDKEIVDTVEIDNANIPETVKVGKETEIIVIEKYYEGELVERSYKDLTKKKNNIYEEEESGKTIKLPVYGDKGILINVAEVKIKRK